MLERPHVGTNSFFYNKKREGGKVRVEKLGGSIRPHKVNKENDVVNKTVADACSLGANTER